ncbi:hypothetical protein LTR53_013237 [Teratosphaeriaceae sp. CCFEE 6253]|nr:hypothetical protein LTR53_013237 [Teratosphaeriaceae sp. CCFEE 6253]
MTRIATYGAPSPAAMIRGVLRPATAMEIEGRQCTVCIDAFTDPVCTPCGHAYCRSCIYTVLSWGDKCPICMRDLFDAGKDGQGLGGVKFDKLASLIWFWAGKIALVVAYVLVSSTLTSRNVRGCRLARR